MKRLLTVLFMFIFIMAGFVSLPSNKVFACSCVGGDTKEKLDRSYAVFVGKVMDKGGTKRFQHGPLREYTFDVDRVWKGVETSPIKIFSYDGGEESCGFKFEEKQSYLVFSYQDKDGSLHTNLCTGNMLFSKAGGEIEKLGTGTILHQDAPKETIKNQYPVYLLFLGVVPIVGIVILFIWRCRRRTW